MIDLAISIVNYKTRELTSRCLESILHQNWQINYEIWLVDNASGEAEVDYFRHNFPQVKLIESKKNLGFAAGHNLALKKIKATYILILNSDTEVLENTLDGMVDFMDQHPKVGIASCKVLDFAGSLQPNGGDLPFGLSFISWLFNLETIGLKTKTFHQSDEPFYQDLREVGWVSGNFMMVRSVVFKKIGLFDEGYFMYFEDVDLCFRAKQAGFDVFINPSFSIKHKGGGSLDNPNLRQWSGEFKGLIYFYRKWFGRNAATFVKMLIIVSTILRIIVFAILGKLNYAKIYAQVIRSI